MPIKLFPYYSKIPPTTDYLNLEARSGDAPLGWPSRRAARRAVGAHSRLLEERVYHL